MENAINMEAKHITENKLDDRIESAYLTIFVEK